MLMDRHLIKDIRLQLEYRYFVEEVTDNYIVFIKIDDENEVRYKVFGIKCPECGAYLLFDMDIVGCQCSNDDCDYKVATTLV